MVTMAFQRVRDTLEEIGLEENRKLFIHKCIEFVIVCRKNDPKGSFGMIPDSGEGNGILIDSVSLLNCARTPLTAVSGHGIISNEVRIIYVLHQRTELPLFMRYVHGNVVDASTVKRTLLKLKA